MKATLEFNLPEDEDAFRLARKGADAAAVIDATLAQLREWLKYGHTFKDAGESLEAVRKFMFDELQERSERIET